MCDGYIQNWLKHEEKKKNQNPAGSPKGVNSPSNMTEDELNNTFESVGDETVQHGGGGGESSR
jgi:hypothetical protein